MCYLEEDFVDDEVGQVLLLSEAVHLDGRVLDKAAAHASKLELDPTLLVFDALTRQKERILLVARLRDRHGR